MAQGNKYKLKRAHELSYVLWNIQHSCCYRVLETQPDTAKGGNVKSVCAKTCGRFVRAKNSILVMQTKLFSTSLKVNFGMLLH